MTNPGGTLAWPAGCSGLRGALRAQVGMGDIKDLEGDRGTAESPVPGVERVWGRESCRGQEGGSRSVKDHRVRQGPGQIWGRRTQGPTSFGGMDSERPRGDRKDSAVAANSVLREVMPGGALCLGCFLSSTLGLGSAGVAPGGPAGQAHALPWVLPPQPASS